MAAFRKDLPWRYIFTDLDGTATSWAYGLQTQRSLTFQLGSAAQISGAVDPSDFRVNGIWTDGYPRVAPLVRLVYGFRREGSAGGRSWEVGKPWKCRAAGILLQPNDQADAEVAVSRFTAFDPRKMLEGRPAMDAGGGLPDQNGLRLLNGTTAFARGDQIVTTMLYNSIVNEDGGDASALHIDAGVAFGGTVFFGGTIEETQPLDLVITAGQMVAEVWSAVEQTGTCDIILNPIYDPRRPGYTHELSVYNRAGSDRYDVVLGWDKLNRAVQKLDRMQDTSPGSFFDKVQYYAGQGGAPVPFNGPLVNADGVAAFGSVWAQQFFPAYQSSLTDTSAILWLAQEALRLAKQGKRTLTIETVTERTPLPLRDFHLGDRINIHASRRVRIKIDGLQRVESIPITISDDGVASLPGLLVSPDYRALAPTPAQQTISTKLVAIDNAARFVRTSVIRIMNITP